MLGYKVSADLIRGLVVGAVYQTTHKIDHIVGLSGSGKHTIDGDARALGELSQP